MGREPGPSEEPNSEPTIDVFLRPVAESLPWALMAESPERLVVAANRRFCTLFARDGDPESLIGSDSRGLGCAAVTRRPKPTA